MPEGVIGPRLRHWVEVVYVAFELVALLALVVATIAAIYEFFSTLIHEGFVYTVVLEKILLIFVFIDLTRTMVGSIVAGRFRMDILLEAITIALARDLILNIATESHSFSIARVLSLGGLLATMVVLWVLAKRVEYRETIMIKEGQG